MTPEEKAEAYCDRPRCAQMTRNDKAWHRTKAAYLEAYGQGQADLLERMMEDSFKEEYTSTLLAFLQRYRKEK